MTGQVNSIVSTIVSTIINPAIALVFAVGFLVFIVGIVEYLAGLNAGIKFGPEDPRTKGRKHMLYGILGMFIMVSAYSIIRVIAGTFGTQLPF